MSQICCKFIPEMKTPLYTGKIHQVPKVSTIEGFQYINCKFHHRSNVCITGITGAVFVSCMSLLLIK